MFPPIRVKMLSRSSRFPYATSGSNGGKYGIVGMRIYLHVCVIDQPFLLQTECHGGMIGFKMAFNRLVGGIFYGWNQACNRPIWTRLQF
jgi:hypothetical protein